MNMSESLHNNIAKWLSLVGASALGIAIVLLIMVVSSTGVLAENSSLVEIKIETTGDMESQIVQIAEGDIETSLYCEGNNCDYNVYGGSVKAGPGVSINEYITKDGSGISFWKLVERLHKGATKYLRGELRPENSEYWFFNTMSMVYATRQEHESVSHNIEYLAGEIDRLNAENELLKDYLELEWNQTLLDLAIAKQKSKRVGVDIETTNGYTCSQEMGACIKIVPIVKEEFNATEFLEALMEDNSTNFTTINYVNTSQFRIDVGIINTTYKNGTSNGEINNE